MISKKITSNWNEFKYAEVAITKDLGMEPLWVYSASPPQALLSERGMRQGMSVFHHTDKKRRRLRLTTDAEGRLPRGRSLLIIGVLSALSWLVLIALFIALRAFL